MGYTPCVEYHWRSWILGSKLTEYCLRLIVVGGHILQRVVGELFVEWESTTSRNYIPKNRSAKSISLCHGFSGHNYGCIGVIGGPGLTAL